MAEDAQPMHTASLMMYNLLTREVPILRGLLLVNGKNASTCLPSIFLELAAVALPAQGSPFALGILLP
jgi:hypothetical protein